MTTSTNASPNAMPKIGGVRKQIMDALLKIGQTSRKEVRFRESGKVTTVDPRTGEKFQLPKYDRKVIDVPVPTLAGNVSQRNVERIIRRWVA